MVSVKYSPNFSQWFRKLSRKVIEKAARRGCAIGQPLAKRPLEYFVGHKTDKGGKAGSVTR